MELECSHLHVMIFTTSWLVDSVIFSCFAVFLLYKYLTRNFDYWKKRGVFSFAPAPLFGNFFEAFTFKINVAENLKGFYDQTDEPYFGIFVFDTPVLVVKSPEIIKTILIKDFSCFNDRSFASPVNNPLYSNFLIFQKYDKWKNTRAKVRPIFGAGTIKLIFPTLIDVTEQFKEYLKKSLGRHSAKAVSQRFSSEVVARCFFGLNGKSFESEESQFLQTSKSVFAFNMRNAVVQLMYLFKPEFVEFFKLSFISKTEEHFLVGVLRKCIESRKGRTEKVRDFVDCMMKETSENPEKDAMTTMANSVESFVAGTETISSTLCYTLYHLALDQKIQENLRKEAQTILEKYGSFTYDSLQDMKYADMCVDETTRRYVTLQFINRTAVQDYKLAETGLLIEKGTIIYIPTYAIHMDEKYFPDPEEFKPERFLNSNINAGTLYYLPFGAGPRMCVAAKLSKLVIIYVLAEIVSNFRIESCEDTPRKILFEPKAFTMQPAVDLPVDFKLL